MHGTDGLAQDIVQTLDGELDVLTHPLCLSSMNTRGVIAGFFPGQDLEQGSTGIPWSFYVP